MPGDRHQTFAQVNESVYKVHISAERLMGYPQSADPHQASISGDEAPVGAGGGQDAPTGVDRQGRSRPAAGPPPR